MLPSLAAAHDGIRTYRRALAQYVEAGTHEGAAGPALAERLGRATRGLEDRLAALTTHLEASPGDATLLDEVTILLTRSAPALERAAEAFAAEEHLTRQHALAVPHVRQVVAQLREAATVVERLVLDDTLPTWAADVAVEEDEEPAREAPGGVAQVAAAPRRA